MEVRAPRVYDLMVDENGERQRFKSVILSTCAARPKSRRSCRSYISMASPAETSSRLLYKKSYPKAVSVFEAGIADTLTYLSYPGSYRARIRSTNMLERLFKEIKRGTRVVGVLPNETSASTLATEIAQRSSEEWALMRNLTMDALETLRKPDSQLSRH